MPSTITAKFDTRREAEMAVERLVQEFQVERTDIFVTTDGDENSAGDETAGSDNAAAEPTTESRSDAALTGKITVSVDVQDDSSAANVRAALTEFGGSPQAS
ncbi:hypothetical protein PQ455_13465 [Sphingomonas naphthae]|uniref:Uncharacterized protein n=1 Tax=Sphingomonas naphthae TaxID=1813468 RepID=A0ABY7TI22_9SPHN|nr:hypothetical protein [Sphingomonas naphthae]WCT72636.1 hypothetical protein PQ455_13465 [Sphingomonas naphthae]